MKQKLTCILIRGIISLQDIYGKSVDFEGELMKRKKKWLILALFCVVLLSLFLFRGHFEKMILEKTLPGEWTLLAGGGFDFCEFDTNGTVMITNSPDQTPYMASWHLECSNSAQRQSFWSHPNVILVVDDEEYGIRLNLDSSLNGLYADGKQVYPSLFSFSFSLTFGEGGGQYVRPY